MKKKLVSLLSLILAVVMVFPTMVFADGDARAAAIIMYHDGQENTKTMVVPEGETATSWISSNPSVASVDNTGKVTALAVGTAVISAFDADFQQIETYDIEVKARTLDKISVKTNPTTMDYHSGDVFDPTGMVIEAEYDNGDKDSISSGYTYTPTGALNTANNKITITYGGKTCELTVHVTELLVTKVEVINPTVNYTEGDKITNVQVKVTYNDGNTETITSGFTVSLTEALKTTDKSFTVTYRGITSEPVAITVSAKPAESTPPETDAPSTEPETHTYLAVMTGAPTKTTYKAGEKFNPSGMKVKLYVDGVEKQSITITSASSNYTFAESEIGNTSISFTFDYKINNTIGAQTYTCEVTGLTITSASDSRRLYSVTGVELKEDEYPVGYEFTKDDIKELKVKLYKESSSSTQTVELDYDELSGYDFFSDVSLEVLDDDGDQKTSSAYRDTIQDADVIEDSDGDKTVKMRVVYKYYKNSTTSTQSTNYYNFTVEIGEPDISYIYDGDLIAVYEELEDALTYCNEQDDDVDEDDFDVDDVKDSKAITLKLGKDYKISSSFDDFSPYHNIIIDLNGYDLTFYTDTIVIDEDDEDYTVTIKNSSKTESKFTYYDKDVTLTLAQNDSFKFEYDKELPGFYTVEVTVGSNGKVTASPALSSNKVEVGMGSDVKFTITPDKGYEVDTVKAAGKSVTSDTTNYKVASTGVATYTLAKVAKDTKVEVTFKQTKSTWKNPFSDVRESANYYSAVEFVCTHELFQGTSNSTFAPNSTMTRAMFVTVLGRLSGLTDAAAKTKYGTKSDFTDVSTSNARITYAVPYIKWATENGLIEGYGDGTFGPENPITHQQMYVLMYRYAMFVENLRTSTTGVSLSMTDRSSVADWASDAVKYAQAKEFLVYTSGSRIDPTGNALRCELAQLLEKFCETVLNWAE